MPINGVSGSYTTTYDTYSTYNEPRSENTDQVEQRRVSEDIRQEDNQRREAQVNRSNELSNQTIGSKVDLIV
ncbi:MAG: hypothetical protein SVN78_01645 [Deferribacterota bacterium]|nr:hypothetical protein [Deferribacterota bacterium]